MDGRVQLQLYLPMSLMRLLAHCAIHGDGVIFGTFSCSQIGASNFLGGLVLGLRVCSLKIRPGVEHFTFVDSAK